MKTGKSQQMASGKSHDRGSIEKNKKGETECR